MPILPTKLHKEGNIIRVEGELTFDTVMLLLKEFRHFAKDKDNVVDLAAIKRADSAGVALLCELRRQSPSVKFQHLPQQLQRIVELSGLTNIL